MKHLKNKLKHLNKYKNFMLGKNVIFPRFLSLRIIPVIQPILTHYSFM